LSKRGKGPWGGDLKTPNSGFLVFVKRGEKGNFLSFIQKLEFSGEKRRETPRIRVLKSQNGNSCLSGQQTKQKASSESTENEEICALFNSHLNELGIGEYQLLAMH
jgi:hypothetical protein